MSLQTWISAVPYASRLDPENAIFGELAYCLAVEEVGGIEVSKRNAMIRTLVCELSRVSSHLGYLARVGRAIGAETLSHYALRDREKLLDYLELLSGARFSLHFVRIGGISEEVTDGFIERVLDAADLIRIRIKEYNDLLSYNFPFSNRAKGVGTLSIEDARAEGVSGPNGRASGRQYDVRRSSPYSGYQYLDLSQSVSNHAGATDGDVHARYLIRIREMIESLNIIREAVEKLPPSDGKKTFGNHERLPPGEACVRVESPRGVLLCHVVSNGGVGPCNVQFGTPSAPALQSVSRLLTRARVEDLPLILASMDICVAEVDR